MSEKKRYFSLYLIRVEIILYRSSILVSVLVIVAEFNYLEGVIRKYQYHNKLDELSLYYRSQTNCLLYIPGGPSKCIPTMHSTDSYTNEMMETRPVHVITKCGCGSG